MIFTKEEEKWVDKELVFLGMASRYAKKYSGCTKVSVGCCIVSPQSLTKVLGANRTIPDECKTKGCLRVEKYGENSKAHRNPEDCRAIHSEVDAIGAAAKHGMSLENSTIYITRYPCEACAKLIIAAGIKRVVYGRSQLVSDLTQQMFDEAGVKCINRPDFVEEDTNV